ncbi:RNA polymerase sigma factor [Actinomadura macra]|uniref:RNA polymerase sigma factor n=1 Tax=Actinomadura macra TaxID=46164 RepID=UPI00082F82C3|nr:SigE family RNA polymerase sigma factor [Actinomadura macra]
MKGIVTTPPPTLSDLYRTHAAGLMRLAALMVGDPVTAEDVVQDAFLGLHRKWARLHDPAAALTYVRSAVLNRCRSVLRRRAVAARFGHAYEPPVWSAESVALIGEERRELLAAVAALPRRQREVLALRYFCELPENEIARILGISRGTVSSTASRAMSTLARTLGEEQ